MLAEHIGTRRRFVRTPVLLGLAVFGIWAELPFVAWLGVGFLIAEYQPTRTRQALMSSIAFVVGGVILLIEALIFGDYAYGSSVLGIGTALVLVLCGGFLLIRLLRL